MDKSVGVFSESELVRLLREILQESGVEGLLITKLGHALQFKTFGTSISAYIRDTYGGLLNLLNKHSDKFSVSGSSPKYVITLNENKPHSPAAQPLSKEMLLLTRYKTIPCQHDENGLPCPHELCNFAHGEKERRRNPMSPFFVSYGPTLCPYREGDTCIHGKACTSSCNNMEMLYHPENYRVCFCSTTVTRSKCKQYPVCPYAHNAHELRLKPSLDVQKNSIAYQARYQRWDKVMEQLKQIEMSPFPEDEILKDVYQLSRETALHYAVKYCKADVIQYILRIAPKINVNVRDIFGQTPLHKLAAYGGGDASSAWLDSLRVLVYAGADPCIKDFEGHDAFYFNKKNTATSSLQPQLAVELKVLAEKYIYKDTPLTITDTSDDGDRESTPKNATVAYGSSSPSSMSETFSSSSGTGSIVVKEALISNKYDQDELPSQNQDSKPSIPASATSEPDTLVGSWSKIQPMMDGKREEHHKIPLTAPLIVDKNEPFTLETARWYWTSCGPNVTYFAEVDRNSVPYDEETSQILETLYSRARHATMSFKEQDSSRDWIVDLETMRATCTDSSVEDRQLIRMVQTYYIYGRTVHVREPKLVELKAVSKYRSPIEDITSPHLMRNVVAFLNSIHEGEIGKIYFGIDDHGKILGTSLTAQEAAKLPSAIWEKVKDIDPNLKGHELDVFLVPLCSKEEGVVKHMADSYVVEVHVKQALDSVYFTPEGDCWTRRTGGVLQLKGSQIPSLKAVRDIESIILAPRKSKMLEAEYFEKFAIEQIESLSAACEMVLQAIVKARTEKHVVWDQESTEEIMKLEEMYKPTVQKVSEIVNAQTQEISSEMSKFHGTGYSKGEIPRKPDGPDPDGPDPDGPDSSRHHKSLDRSDPDRSNPGGSNPGGSNTNTQSTSGAYYENRLPTSNFQHELSLKGNSVPKDLTLMCGGRLLDREMQRYYCPSPPSSRASVACVLSTLRRLGQATLVSGLVHYA